MVDFHLNELEIRSIFAINSGESRTTTVPSGRSNRSISTKTSTILHLQQKQETLLITYIY
ncbi:hypothetical protein Hanom_Chr16g01495501 [Helianthus anomalus]